jgi:hypothetical protein
MARIRTIKPEFWTDGVVVTMSPFARLMFIGCWNFALCDRGHVADDPTRLKLQILPMDDVDPVALIDELLANERLTRIKLDGGRTFLHIRRFEEHQKIEKRWVPRCPACIGLRLETPPGTSPELARAPESSPDLSRSLPNSPNPAVEGKGREGKRTSSSTAVDAVFDRFWKAYPRKVGKAAAVKSWKAAINRGADPEQMATAAEAFRIQSAHTEKQYIPHPSTWLSQGRYEDEPEPATRSTGWWDN